MAAALDNLRKQMKLWSSVSGKPGPPSMHLREAYTKTLTTLRMTGSGGEKFPEVAVERAWEDVVKKLRDYTFDVPTYGSLNEFSKKIAYFFHASIQGTGAYSGAAETLRLLAAGNRP